MRLLLILPLLAACGSPPADGDVGPLGMRPVYTQDFWDAGATREFWLTEPQNWKVEFLPPREDSAPIPEGPSSWLTAFHRPEGPPFAYAPPHRSPFRMAIAKGFTVEDFVLEVEVQSTGRSYPGRDLCLIFGFEDAEHFAYVHLATLPDDRNHNLFVVDGADARPVGRVPDGGLPWTDGTWHTLRLERRVADGLVRVTLDDFEEPLLELTEFTRTRGHIGIGTYDDTGRFAGLRVLAGRVGDPVILSDPFVEGRR